MWSLRDYAFLERGRGAADRESRASGVRPASTCTTGSSRSPSAIYQIRGFDISNMTLIEGDRGADRHRSADLDRDGARRPRSLLAASRPAAGHRGHLHPQPHRSLRRRARGDRRGRCPRRARARSSRRCGSWRRSSPRTCSPAPPMVRRAQFQFGAHAAQGTARPGRRRARQGRLARNGHADPAHPRDQPSRSRPTGSTASRSCSSWRPRPRRRPRCTCSIPALRALNLAENATHNLHNIYPIRGAQVRDANAWAKYLERGARSVRAATPTSPSRSTTGRCGARARARLPEPAARSLQVPARPDRAAHEPRLQARSRSPSALALPRSLAAHLARARLLRHAQPQRQARSTSATSAGTTPTRPTSTRCRRSSAGGSTSSTWAAPTPCVARAREDFARGEYRFVAEAMSHVVFADPGQRRGARLGADALEQLGYAAESATWRNAYLLGARELRQGVPAAAARAPVEPRHGPGHEPRPVLRLPRRAPERRQGRGPASGHQLGVHRRRPRATCSIWRTAPSRIWPTVSARTPMRP